MIPFAIVDACLDARIVLSKIEDVRLRDAVWCFYALGWSRRRIATLLHLKGVSGVWYCLSRCLSRLREEVGK